MTLTQWQASGSARDADAVGCPPLTQPISHLLINRSTTQKTFALSPGSFHTAQGLPISDELIIPAFSSRIIFQEQLQFQSLATLITILHVLAGLEGSTVELLDIDGNGIVGLTDALQLHALLVQ